MNITSIDDLDVNKKYTYSDYLTWHFQERVELIKGILHKMSPAPRRVHQKVSLNITTLINSYLRKRPCELYVAPFDVRFSKGESSDQEIQTVVQPDLCIICDLSKLDDAGCNGAPDLIVEILSPSTSKKDAKDKFELYEEYGVREYWMVHLDEKLIDVFHLNERKYELDKIYTDEDQIQSFAVKGLTIDVKEVFED